MRDTKALRLARERQTDPYKRRFARAKWNRTVRVTDDHRLFARLPEFAAFDKPRHFAEAITLLRTAVVFQQTHPELAKKAIDFFGDGNGQLIAGIVRQHFPPAIADVLRTLAYDGTEYLDRSLAHWKASGRRQAQWLQLVASYL